MLRRPPSFRNLEIYQHLSCTDLRQGDSKSKSQKVGAWIIDKVSTWAQIPTRPGIS